MKVSRRADYALRVLFTLIEQECGKPISIRELAAWNLIPKPFLEHIMLDLKAQRWVASVAGKHGGYVLAQSASEITMGQVVRHFDGVLAPIGCVSASQYEPCALESTCRFRRVFLHIRNETAKYMDSATLASVYAQPLVSTREVFDEILMSGAGI
jgi:Rrf2 family protein